MYADTWLWKFARGREKTRAYRLRDLALYRQRTRLKTRRYRERLKQRARDEIIRVVYWHEVHHPTLPITRFSTAPKSR